MPKHALALKWWPACEEKQQSRPGSLGSWVLLWALTSWLFPVIVTQFPHLSHLRLPVLSSFPGVPVGETKEQMTGTNDKGD